MKLTLGGRAEMLRCGESFAVSDTELSDGWCHVPCGRFMCVSDGVDGRRSWVGAVIVEADDPFLLKRLPFPRESCDFEDLREV